MNLTNIIFQLSLFPETTFKRRPAYLHPTSLSDENLLKFCCRYNTPGLFIKFSTSNGLIHLPSNPPLPPKFFPIKYFRWGEKGFHNSVKKLDNSLTAFITFRAFNPYPAILLKWGQKEMIIPPRSLWIPNCPEVHSSSIPYLPTSIEQ